MQWIESNGAALRYDLAGDGPRTIVLIHEMGGDFDLVAVKIEFAVFCLRRLIYRRPINRLFYVGFSNNLRNAAFLNLLLGELDRFTIEGRVGKQESGRAGIIQNIEPKFSVVIAYACAADTLVVFRTSIHKLRQSSRPPSF